jgi:transposase InsO family protein
LGVFLQDKSETQEALKKFLRRVQNKFNVKVKKTRSDNSTKFKNTQVENFLDEEDIKHEFLAIYTPQQNGVAKRKNHTLIDTACHATNRLYLCKLLKKISYKLLTGNKPNVSYFLFLEVSAMFYIRGKSFLNLLLKFMRVSCLVMIEILAHTVFLM